MTCLMVLSSSEGEFLLTCGFGVVILVARGNRYTVTCTTTKRQHLPGQAADRRRASYEGGIAGPARVFDGSRCCYGSRSVNGPHLMQGSAPPRCRRDYTTRGRGTPTAAPRTSRRPGLSRRAGGIGRQAHPDELDDADPRDAMCGDSELHPERYGTHAGTTARGG
jgi:hypothetical protein